MAMKKFREPSPEEKAILIRNGVEPNGVSVTFRDENTIHLIRHKTRDEITIKQGDKQW